MNAVFVHVSVAHGMCVVMVMLVVDVSDRGCHDESRETSK